MRDEVDSCYSWVVVGVGFVVYFLNYGIVRISGLLYSHIITYYDVDREQASSPFLMGSVARAISGPVIGYLSHTFGFRFAITLGCLLSSFGIFASSFAPDIVTFCIFWSIYGFGYGMAALIFPRVINMFNKKHASNANGISQSGVPFAGMLLTPLTVALLKTYEMPGTFLILSALVLNSIPAIMILKNPNSTNVKDRPRPNNSLKHIFSENSEEKKQFLRNTEHDTFKDLSSNGHCHDTETAQSNDKITADSSLNKCETPIRILLENSLTNSAISSGQMPVCKPRKKQNCLQIFSIFWDPLFIIFSIVRCYCNLLFVIVPTIIVDFSIDKGIMRNQASYVLVAYSVGDLLGKAGLGWITDSNYISRINYVFLCFCIMALSCALLAWANGFPPMAAGVFLVATGNATNAINLIVLVGEFFKQEKQSMAMASSGIFLLPMAFGTASLIGYFRDTLRCYDGLAYTLGAASLVCSGLVIIIPRISNFKTSKKLEKKTFTT